MHKEIEIEKILKQGRSYFVKDEKIYVYEYTKYYKLDPVPSFIINVQFVFLNFIKAQKLYEIEYPYCGNLSFTIKTSDD